MPITFYINQSKELMVSKFAGEISDAELNNSYQRLLNSDKYKLGTDEIVDLTTVDNCDFTMEGLRGVHDLICEAYMNTTFYKLTAVVTSEAKCIGLVDTYQSFKRRHTSEETNYFNTILDAAKWLKKGPDILLRDNERWEIVSA